MCRCPRLTGVLPGSGQDFDYDRYANLSGISVTQCSAPTLGLSINDTNNRILNAGFSYDAAGNLLTDGFSAYVWNAEGRMDSAAGYTYTYDGVGRRVEKAAAGHGLGSAGRNPGQQVHNSATS